MYMNDFHDLATDCMAIIAERFQEECFSENSANLASRGRREFIYKYTLHVFDHSSTGVNKRNYSVWSLYWRDSQLFQIQGWPRFLDRFGEGLEISNLSHPPWLLAWVSINLCIFLIEVMFWETPVRKIMPSWDLPTVLEFLRSLLFEPAQTASLWDLPLKTVFLIAMASGRRSSELHELAIGKYVVFGKLGVTLHFCPGFLATNERSDFQRRHCSSLLWTINQFKEEIVWTAQFGYSDGI